MKLHFLYNNVDTFRTNYKRELGSFAKYLEDRVPNGLLNFLDLQQKSIMVMMTDITAQIQEGEKDYNTPQIQDSELSVKKVKFAVMKTKRKFSACNRYDESIRG